MQCPLNFYSEKHATSLCNFSSLYSSNHESWNASLSFVYVSVIHFLSTFLLSLYLEKLFSSCWSTSSADSQLATCQVIIFSNEHTLSIQIESTPISPDNVCASLMWIPCVPQIFHCSEPLDAWPCFQCQLLRVEVGYIPVEGAINRARQYDWRVYCVSDVN